MSRRLICFCLFLVLGVVSNSYADIIGDWEDNNDGWIDWGNMFLITDPCNTSRYSFSTTTGVTLHSHSLVVTGIISNTQCLTADLTYDQRVRFMANNVFLIDYTVAAGTTGGWNEIYNISLNADGYGWHDQFTAPAQHFDFWGGSPQRAATVSFNYTAAKASMPSVPSYVQIVFSLNSGSGTNSHEFYFDNARLVTTAAQDPSPADEATGVNLGPVLSWTAGYGADSHNVYFGTDNPPSFVQNQSATTYNPGTLEKSKTYYWRIDEVNDTDGNTTGTVWSFTTGNISPLTIKKCTVTAGSTEANDANLLQDATDINKMKDSFTASGTGAFPTDLNDVNYINVDIVSGDGNVIYSETIDFNDHNDVVLKHGKYNYSHKITKKVPRGAITSLKIDFTKDPQTFALTAKNINLTGLACPVELDFEMGTNVFLGEANEAIVNGSKKLIPTRLMRMYQDTLIVTKAKVKNSTKSGGDSLSVQGAIAVEDINNTDINEPNLAAGDVNIIWGPQNFVIKPHGLKAAKKGHSYTCSKAAADTNVGDAGSITAAIDLDKCTYSLSVSSVNLTDVNGVVPFNLRFANFNAEPVDVNLARGY